MSLAFVMERATKSRSVMNQLLPEWQWPEKTPDEFGDGLTALLGQQEALTEREAAARGANAAYQADLDWLHDNTVVGLRLARVKYRHDPVKLARFRNLTADGRSRELVYTEALNLESAWKNADPAWVPVDGLTLAAFKLKRQGVPTEQEALADADGAESEERARLNQQADDLHALLIAWYEEATAVFPAGTVKGELIRAQVPTTYVPQLPPGQAEISMAVSDGPGKAHLHYDAERASSFDVLAKGPGQTQFAKVVAGTTVTIQEFTNLAAGEWTYVVVPFNSAGPGPASVEKKVTVPAVAAA